MIFQQFEQCFPDFLKLPINFSLIKPFNCGDHYSARNFPKNFAKLFLTFLQFCTWNQPEKEFC